MSPFAVFALCIQVCLIQAAFGQRICSSNVGASNVNLAPRALNTNRATGSYGGIGYGDVTAVGDVSAYGDTDLIGSVPVAGLASFGGPIPASGSVFITGECGCGRA